MESAKQAGATLAYEESQATLLQICFGKGLRYKIVYLFATSIVAIC